ncbi:hypothetical protein [Halomonas elongata]|uniref:hypothetical protein n=1 Tax=Halomonas elongata TaxID=2746 RepID=UPI0023B0DC34|nr:hypothetical protein [Halomonas elongata]
MIDTLLAGWVDPSTPAYVEALPIASSSVHRHERRGACQCQLINMTAITWMILPFNDSSTAILAISWHP